MVPKVSLAIVAAFLLYGWAVADPNTTGNPIQVLGMFGTILLYAAILATFATIFVAARRAHLVGSWVWFATVIFIWPLSYFYALVVNRKG
ncbi:hypothetical protein [Pseudoxanthomonas kalamensis]|uniref:hypothetical protein n=1 Tax=Pseudoxanthomonas kalamensis TaxID=289483 RepID=UPI001390A021|nr:hypothetical protein [Pseudoxanthomonas kalamensis]